MLMFFAQLILFFVGLKCFKEIVGLLREWIHELVHAMSPENIRKRREQDHLRKELEAAAEAEIKKESEEKED